MLTGAMAPTDGYAMVAGKDIRTDMEGIRRDIGICLQHDCLVPHLTVREHIQFFSRIKGLYKQVPRAEAEAQIDQSIRDVALYDKRHTLSMNLSGGMKRKLSLAMAFCGGSKVVLLDEPTSGMYVSQVCVLRNVFLRNLFVVSLNTIFAGIRSRDVSHGMLFETIAKTESSFSQRILWTKQIFSATELL